jgi:hypothetical protein
MSDYPPFDEFTRIARDQFAFLHGKYGFDTCQVSENPHECAVSVQFMNETTGVEVAFSTFRHMPNVSLHRLHSDPRRWNYQGYGLVYLIRERCPEEEISESVGSALNAALIAYKKPGDIAPVSKLLVQILSTYASVLDEHATDVLNGDFSIVPRLENQARREQRRLGRPQKSKTAKRR